MEAVWFRSHGQDATQIFTLPPIQDGPSVGASRTTPVARGTARVAEAWPPREEAGFPALPTRTPGSTAPSGCRRGRPCAAGAGRAAAR